MGLDLRIPVGTLFAVIGVLLAAYGGATLGEPGTAPMLALARRARRAARGNSKPDAEHGPRVT